MRASLPLPAEWREGRSRPPRRIAGMHRRGRRMFQDTFAVERTERRVVRRAPLFSVAEPGGEPVKQDVVLVASENAETRQELAERLDWDDVPFHLASSAH